MKTPKPGQLCTINNVVYRAKARALLSSGCDGCALDSIDMCPNVTDFRSKPVLECALNNIILVKV